MSSRVWCVKREWGAVAGVAGSVADRLAMIRRFLADECARARFEDCAGMRIRSVDFFERFRGWGLVSTQRYTIARFGIELAEFLRGLTEINALQSTLTKGRSNEGVYYCVHWRKLRAHLESDTDEDGKLSDPPEGARAGWQEGLGGESSRGGGARGRCERQRSVIRIRSFVASGLKRVGCVKDRTTLKYLGADSFDTVIQHIETKMRNYNALCPDDTQMTFQNMQLDHIRPVQRFALDMNHYTNLQPMLAEANLCKSARWSSADEIFWKTHIHHNADFAEIYPAHKRASLKQRDPAAFAVKKQKYRMALARHFGVMPKRQSYGGASTGGSQSAQTSELIAGSQAVL